MSEILIYSKIYLDEKWIITVYSENEKEIILKLIKKYNIDVSVRIDKGRYGYRGF